MREADITVEYLTRRNKKMSNEIVLRPSYWASVSGGKDSLYMLNLILHNLDKYPLDGVVHFELEIDYPFIHNVIDYMQAECERHGIKFFRIKPEKTWEELYHTSYANGNIWGFPTRKVCWCNSKYKLSAKKKMEEFLRSKGFYSVCYIGYCADEEKRFAKRVGLQKVERYPLVEEGINEDIILQWAKTQPIFNHYYETQKRCGCMFCPMAPKLTHAYTAKYYPEMFDLMIEKMRETEQIRTKELGRPFSVTASNSKYNADYLDNIIRLKYVPLLESKERYQQQSFFKEIDEEIANDNRTKPYIQR